LNCSSDEQWRREVAKQKEEERGGGTDLRWLPWRLMIVPASDGGVVVANWGAESGRPTFLLLLLLCFFVLFFFFRSLLFSDSSSISVVAASNDEEREAGERGYCSSLLLYYLVFSILSLCSLVGSNLPLSLPGSTSSCSRCCWWRWRGKNNDGAQGVRNGSSSSLCRDL